VVKIARQDSTAENGKRLTTSHIGIAGQLL